LAWQGAKCDGRQDQNKANAVAKSTYSSKDYLDTSRKLNKRRLAHVCAASFFGDTVRQNSALGKSNAARQGKQKPAGEKRNCTGGNVPDAITSVVTIERYNQQVVEQAATADRRVLGSRSNTVPSSTKSRH
jgi:hypothetical protein